MQVDDGNDPAHPDAYGRFASVRFRPPGSAGGLVHRNELVDDLVAGLRSHRLTAVVAPAGYGKTTLTTSATRAMGDGGPAWVSLDPSDDDPRRFWHVLAHGLSRSPSTDLTSLGHGGTDDDRDDTVRAARGWTAVRDLLSALETASDMVLVLDDLHHLTDPTLVDQLRFLVEHAPANLHLAVLSRRRPPLPLARLRGQGHLFELGVEELCLTWDETVRLFELRALDVPTEELRTLHERTRGWPAGVQLAASALQLVDDASQRTARMRALSRSEQHMRDVLADEVLAGLDPTDRGFLHDIAVVDRLTPADATRLSDAPDAGAQLERLHRSGVALLRRTDPAADGEPPVYQHHPLFSSLLRERLRRDDPERLADLHSRAAELADDPLHALAHRTEAGDLEQAVRLLEDQGPSLLARGGARHVLAALDALPKELVASSARLLACAGRARWQTGDHLGAGAALRRAAAAHGREGRADQQALALVAAADCALLRGDVRQAVRDVEEALSAGPPAADLAHAHAVRLRVAQFAGAGAIDEVADDAVAAALDQPTPATLRDTARSLWMGVAVAPDGLDLLGRFCDVAWPAIAADDGFARACLLGLSATVALYRGELEAAAQQATDALALWDDLGVAPPIHAQSARALVVLAATALDDQASLHRWVPELRAGAEQIALPQVRISAGLLEARVRWLRDDREGLRGVVARLPSIDGPAAALVDIPRAMLALQDRDRDTAIDLLHGAVEVEERFDRRNLFAAPGVLLAGIHAEDGDDARALEVGLPTLDVCARDRCPGRILLEGPRALPLLELAIASGRHVGMAKQLAATLGATPAGPVEVPDTGETLTPREVEVLRLVTAGATNPQIAERLDVSDETVKTHVSRILRKLDVPTRTAAAGRAHSLGVSPSEAVSW